MSENARGTLTTRPVSAAVQPVAGTAGGLRIVGGGDVEILPDTPVTAVHADGAGLWVLADRRHLHRVEGGRAELVASLDGAAAGVCVATHAGDVWVGGERARLWRRRGGELEEVASFQEAPSRPDWHTPWGGPPAVFSMASDGTALYVSVHVGGILRSTDGVTWEPTIDLHDDVHQVAVGPDGTLWAATGMRGLAESTDHGASWRYHTDGLHARYLLAVAPVPGGALVGASSGHAARDGAIYRFGPDGFVPARGLPDDLRGAVGPRQLAAVGDHAAVALPGGDLYVSSDGGSRWERRTTGLPSVSEVALSAAGPAG